MEKITLDPTEVLDDKELDEEKVAKEIEELTGEKYEREVNKRMKEANASAEEKDKNEYEDTMAELKDHMEKVGVVDKIIERHKEKSRKGSTYDDSYEEAIKGLKPDENNPDFKPIYSEDKISFDIDSRYVFEQREKIENYTESLDKEIREIKRLGGDSGLDINLAVNAKRREIDYIAGIARKKSFFGGGRNKKIIDGLEYTGDPTENAERILEKLKSQIKAK